MIGKDELLDYIEFETPKKVKQLALTMGALLNDNQLQVLSRRFRTKYEFDPELAKEKPVPQPEQEIPEMPPKQEKPVESDPLVNLDLDLDESD